MRFSPEDRKRVEAAAKASNKTDKVDALENAGKSAEVKPRRKPFFRPRWARLINYIDRKIKNRKTKIQNQNTKESPEEVTANATKWMMRFTFVLAAVGALTLEVLNLQLGEMQGSSAQTDRMIRLYRAQVAQLSRQAGDTHDLAVQMKNQADRTKDLTDQTKTIANQAVIQANAARSAAETAKDTLHVSERAYVVFGNPSIDMAKKMIKLQFVDTGRIPSGRAEVETHEATFNITGPTVKPQFSEAIEKSWQTTKFPSINPSVPMSLGVPVPSLLEGSLNSGLQIIVVVGIISYNDGFSDTPQQQQQFCVQTTYHLVSKEIYLTPCDASAYLPQMRAVDGYPNNEHHD